MRVNSQALGEQLCNQKSKRDKKTGQGGGKPKPQKEDNTGSIDIIKFHNVMAAKV